MRAYSCDLRVRVLADFDGGLGNEAVARKYRVSSRWVYKLRRQREQTGEIAPLRGRTGPERVLSGQEDRLVELVRSRPDATLRELRDALGLSVSVVTIWRSLKRLGFTLKKSPACR